MTKYGFDLDGVLDRPALAALANDLFDAGHEIYVITGGLADSGEWTMPARQERLARYDVRYTEIIRCIDPDINKIGTLKGRKCNELGISVLIDDSLLYLKTAQGVSAVEKLLVI